MSTNSGPDDRSPLLKPIDLIDWVALGKIANSFLGRALGVLSLTSLFLSNFADLLERNGIPTDSVKRLFIGSAIFLAGTLIYLVRVPTQLSSGGEVYEIVSRMKSLTDWSFFEGQRLIAGNAYTRISGKSHWYIPPASLVFLKARIDSTATLAEEGDWLNRIPGLYQAHLETIRYDRPYARLLAALFLLAGVCFLFFPLVTRILSAAASLS